MDPLEAYLAEHDAACPGCGYNLRGLRGRKCPECGKAIDAAGVVPRTPRPLTRRFRSTRGAAAAAWAIGASVLLYEGPRAWGRGTAGVVMAAGAGTLAIGLAWLIFANRIAEASPAVQGRIAAAMWAAIAILGIAALGAR